MVVHVVLYRPKPNLQEHARASIVEAVAIARDEIPQIRRFVVGRRIEDGPSYSIGTFPDLPYIAMLEFRDREGLEAYLAHPGHDKLGRLFNETVDAGLIYDYEAVDAGAIAALADD